MQPRRPLAVSAVLPALVLPALVAALVLAALAPGLASAQEWQAQKAPVMTRWAKDVSPANALPEYPRPTMVRKEWQNLNGLWDYAIQPKDEAQPKQFQGKILVPFAPESALSGVMKPVGAANRLWYRRTFDVPAAWRANQQRVLLHFGAVDWDSVVLVNGKEVGKHRGGYDPFFLDITDALKPEGAQEIVVNVWDPTTAGYQPIGKQHAKPGGIWYTPTTGIWQTAWIEPVPAFHIRSIKIVPDVDNASVAVTVVPTGNANEVAAAVAVSDGGTEVASAKGAAGAPITIKVPNPKLWSPDSPHLYDLKVTLTAGAASDTVQSYFGLRKISLAKDDKGVLRLFLNNKPLFQHGPLDQGFWPDGIYTAPTDAALKYDIEITRQMGFNMARKHVKVEPERWYYWADKLGLLVWQDMPSGDKHVRPGAGEITRNKESAENFDRELKAMIDARVNHPSIVMWVPFNEGWGQFDTVRVTNWVKQYDPSRLANPASGWNDFPAGDVKDIHSYPGPAMPQLLENRAVVLGEFGGLGLPLEGHTWQAKGNWGYRSFTDKQALTDAYLGLMIRLRPLIAKGLCAAVYTQTTDVEVEVNGLLTYDREIIKIDQAVLAEAHRKLNLPPPQVSELLPTSEAKAQEWSYTTDKPAPDWAAPEFDASSWKKGPGGFGTKSTPGAVVGTEWKTPDIWVRRTFELKDVPAGAEVMLNIHHDEDADVFVNGVPAGQFTGFTQEYGVAPIAPKARAALRAGKNVIAIHCKQTRGGQFIDAGLVQVKETGK